MEKKKEITVPLEIFEKDFDLVEIGLINLLLASPHIDESKVKEWSQNEDFLRVFHRLMERGYVYISQTDDGNSVTNIDLEPKNNKDMNTGNTERHLTKTLGLDETQTREIMEIIEQMASDSYMMGYDDRRIEEESGALGDDLDTGFTGYGKKEDYA